MVLLWRHWLLCLLLAWPAASGWAQTGVLSADTLQVFVRDNCPHCADAKAFLPEWSQQHPDLHVVYRHVDTDARARDDLIEYARQAGIWPPGVPAFVIHNQVLMGFDTVETTGAALNKLLQTRAPPQPARPTPVLGKLNAAELGLPLFTLVMGLIDGFNPCAMWVLLFLLSMLVHLHSRLRMALIAGTFVLVSGMIYYAFMAAWLNVFMAVGLSRFVQWLLAALALAIGVINIKSAITPEGLHLGIPAAAKPGIYQRIRRIVQSESLLLSLAAAAALAILVNFIELLCTAGLPAMTTAILSQYALSPMTYYGYLGLYIAGYIADDTLMVSMAVIALSHRKLTERSGRRLKLLSGLVMLALGGIMLLRPAWLTQGF